MAKHYHLDYTSNKTVLYFLDILWDIQSGCGRIVEISIVMSVIHGLVLGGTIVEETDPRYVTISM